MDNFIIIEIIDGSLRYCLCKNRDMAGKEATTREALLMKTAEELDKIIASTKRSKYSKKMRNANKFAYGRVVNKYKMGRFVIFKGEGDELTYTLDKEKITSESLPDGCYVIYTDILPEDMTAVDAVEGYKSLMRVEQAFRNMKTVRLEIRPVYQKTDGRIRCHVFLCMLAYYVMWHMKQRLQPLFDSDGKGKARKYTFDSVIEILKCIRNETIDVCGIASSVTSQPNEEQQKILQLLDIKV